MKKLKIFGIVREAIEFVKKNPSVFIPSFFIGLLSSLSFYWEYYEISIKNMPLLSEYIIPILFSLSIFLLNAIIIRIVNDSRKRNFSVTKSAKDVANKTFPLLAGYVALGSFVLFAIFLTLFLSILSIYLLPSAIGFLFTIGILLSAVPATLYTTIRLEFFPYAIITDDKSIVDSFKKSWKITKGNVTSVFLIHLLLIMIVATVLFPTYLITIGLMGEGYEPVLQIPNSIFYMLMAPFSTTVLTIIYRKIS